MRGVPDDTQRLPADVQAVLAQSFREARDALAAGDEALAQSLVETARTVATNKVPESDRRRVLLDGCARVESVLDGEGNPDQRRTLAAEYCDRLHEAVAPGL